MKKIILLGVSALVLSSFQSARADDEDGYPDYNKARRAASSPYYDGGPKPCSYYDCDDNDNKERVKNIEPQAPHQLENTMHEYSYPKGSSAKVIHDMLQPR